MREIKFRYTCKRENGHIFSRVFTLEQIESSEVRQWWEYNHVGKSSLYKDQFTGLFDKNGKEIYVGDIVQDSLFTIAKENNNILTVEFRQSAFCFKEIPNTAFLEAWHDSVEVIGNLYENPELLKEK